MIKTHDKTMVGAGHQSLSVAEKSLISNIRKGLNIHTSDKSLAIEVEGGKDDSPIRHTSEYAP